MTLHQLAVGQYSIALKQCTACTADTSISLPLQKNFSLLFFSKQPSTSPAAHSSASDSLDSCDYWRVFLFLLSYLLLGYFSLACPYIQTALCTCTCFSKSMNKHSHPDRSRRPSWPGYIPRHGHIKFSDAVTRSWA